MARSAYGYTVMEWADEVLPPDAVLLSSHRSMALAPRDAVSMDWLVYTGRTLDEDNPYLQRLKTRQVTHLLVLGAPKNTDVFRDCVGAVTAGPGTVRRATRNPLNAGAFDDVYILEFHHDKLPECVLPGSDADTQDSKNQ